MGLLLLTLPHVGIGSLSSKASFTGIAFLLQDDGYPHQLCLVAEHPTKRALGIRAKCWLPFLRIPLSCFRLGFLPMMMVPIPSMSWLSLDLYAQSLPRFHL